MDVPFCRHHLSPQQIEQPSSPLSPQQTNHAGCPTTTIPSFLSFILPFRLQDAPRFRTRPWFSAGSCRCLAATGPRLLPVGSVRRSTNKPNPTTTTMTVDTNTHHPLLPLPIPLLPAPPARPRTPLSLALALGASPPESPPESTSTGCSSDRPRMPEMSVAATDDALAY